MIGVLWLFLLYYSYPFNQEIAKPVIFFSCLMLGYCFGGDKLAKALLGKIAGYNFRDSNNQDDDKDAVSRPIIKTNNLRTQPQYLSKRFTFFILILLAVWLYWGFSSV